MGHNRRYRGIIAAALALSLGLAGSAIAAEPAGQAEADITNETYRLGSGDKLRVIVFGEDALGGEFMVGSNGKVALPLVGELPAAGLNLNQLQTSIASALADGYLSGPRVSVEVLNYRPFYILGEVNKPGEYPYVNGLTVLNAIATAQGFTYRASTHVAEIRRANGLVEERKSLTANTRVQPGDTIRIKERWF